MGAAGFALPPGAGKTSVRGMDRLNVILMGAGALACPLLEGLLAAGRDEVAAVVTQPDRAGGRGLHSMSAQFSLIKEETSMEGGAGAALWLCSDLGRSTTGEVVHVDAGFHAVGLPEDIEG